MYLKKSIEAYKLQESRESIEKSRVESLPSFINLSKDCKQDFKFVRKFIRPCGDDLEALKNLVSSSEKELFFDVAMVKKVENHLGLSKFRVDLGYIAGILGSAQHCVQLYGRELFWAERV